MTARPGQEPGTQAGDEALDMSELNRDESEENRQAGEKATAEDIVDEPVDTKESEEQTEQRKKEEKKAKLKEFGGPVSFRKLFSTATWFEIGIFILGTVSALIQGAGQPALCVFFGRLIDDVSASGGNMDSFFDGVGETALQFTMIGVVTLVVATLNNCCFGYFTEVQVSRMRPLYFNRLLNRDIGWFDTHDVGALPSEMDEDLDVYMTGLGAKLGISIMSISTVILGYTFALLLSWKVSLFVTAVLPVMALGAVIMAQSVMDMMMEKQGAYATAAKLMDEVLFAVRTVVSFGGEYRELRRYEKGVDVARRGGIIARLKAGLGMGYIMSLYTASIGLAFYVGMRMVKDGEDLSVGQLMSAFFCVIMGGFTLGQVPPGVTGLVQARISMARFYYILDNESEIQRAGEDNRMACPPITSLQLEDVRFSYPSRPTIKVLQGVSLTISKGQKVAVVGESGSGKSTIMALFERFYDPSSGRVLINGQDLKQFSIKSYRSHIGYVGQEPVLFATSVRKNIMQGSEGASTEDMRRVAEYANLSFVEKLPQGFDTYVGSGGSQFSGGQKQRIAIARALIKKPSMLFLDEATSALDSTSEKMIQDTIDSIGSRSDLGMTIVSIAHRLSTVKNSDVIFVMKDGVVAEQGTHNALTARTGGIYAALAAAQAMTLEKQSDSPSVAGNSATDNMPIAGRVSSNGQKKGASSENLNAEMGEDEREKLREKEIAKSYRVPFFRIFLFCKREWWAFIPGVLGAALSGATFPLVGAYALVDGMIAFLQASADPNKFQDDIHEVCIILLILAGMKFLGTMMQFLFFAVLGEAITMRARMTMLTSIFRQEIGYHDDPENTPSRLVKSLSVYAFRISAFCTTLGNSADALVAVGVGVGMAFYYEPVMAAVMLCSVPIFAVAQAIEISVTMGATKNESSQLKQATQIVGESLLGARTVHASGTEKDVVELYQGLTLADKKKAMRANFSKGLGYGVSQGVIFWVCAGGFYFMGFLIDGGNSNFSDGMRAFMGVLYAGLGAGMAFAVVSDIAKAKIAAHDMFAMIDRKSAINGLEATGTSLTQDRSVGRIELENVKFFYPFRPDVQVLKGLSFTVEPGQSVGLCGPSGGGKSTVLAMIQRFYDPQDGKVFVGTGRTALSELNVRWWRKQVGFVGQEPILFDTTILENVRYGLEEGEALSDERLAEVKRMANLNFIDGRKAQGWSTQVGPRGSRLSGGQKQRVAIARALVRDPPILLLDEATSALDSNSEKIVSQALAGARQGRTSFAIAHRLSTIQDCDKIVVVADGQLVEQGNHTELIQLNGVYAKLHAQSTSK